MAYEQNEVEPFFVVPDALTTPASSSSNEYQSPYPPQNASWNAPTPGRNDSNSASRQGLADNRSWLNGPQIESAPTQEACGSFPGDLRRPAACLDYSRCPKDQAGFPILCRPAQSPMPNNSASSGPSSRPHHHSSSPKEPEAAQSEPHKPMQNSGANEPASTTSATAPTTTATSTTGRPAPSRAAPSRSRRDFAPSKPGQRVPHNLVERRYRDNLNAQIEELRSNLPSLRDAYSCNNDVEDCVVPPRIPSKAVVISTASDYIKQLEAEQAQLLERNQALVEQVEGLQKLVKCDDCSVLRYLSSLSVDAQAQGQP
ncbi:hypothetical protein MBLNU230_g8088t1 [Neophaeotheca triangularis]